MNSAYSCWSWSVISLWTCLTEMLLLACHGLSIDGIRSYNLDPPLGWFCMTDLICFSTWNSLRKIFFVPALITSPYSCCCWRLSVVSWGISEVESLSLATRRSSIATFCADFFYAPRGLVRMANLLYLGTWRVLRKTFIVLLLMIFTFIIYWAWYNVLFWVHEIRMLYLAPSRLSWNVVCAYYLNIPCGRPNINKLIYFFTWKRSRKICFVPVLVICLHSCCWSTSTISFWNCSTEMLRLDFHRLLMVIICSYTLDLPCGWLRMNNLIYLSTPKNLQKSILIPRLIICTNFCFWSWPVALMWTYAAGILWWLASQKIFPSVIIVWCRYLYLSCGWLRMTILMRVPTWNNLWKIVLVPVLMICPHRCCWSYSVFSFSF